jgi:hypothetical protein
MKTTNRFAKGTGCYKCECCGKLTRSTGRGDNERLLLCAKCYDDGGMENEHSDTGGMHGHDMITYVDECPTCRAQAATSSTC